MTIPISPSFEIETLTFRENPFHSDPGKIRTIVSETGFFTQEEIGIAVELVSERLSQGAQSGYFFLFAEEKDNIIGYTCYGPVTGTQSSFDLYWIVVDQRFQESGIGRLLNLMTEDAVRKMGGTRLYAETSSKKQYEPTRAFYRKMGYHEAAFLEDFYAPDDGKIIFVKKVV
ncbi:MAG: GNAT family N-acetyltransferase [Proteobacteria bacterium]|nr:GNAT family N-acetyltransferase [Pseudomonadota bacterium]